MSRWAAPVSISNTTPHSQPVQGLQSELTKHQSVNDRVSTTFRAMNNTSKNEQKSGVNKEVDVELTRLLNEILGLQKLSSGDGASVDDQINLPVVGSSTSNVTLLQENEASSTSGQTNHSTYITPDNPIPVGDDEVGHGRKHRKVSQYQQQESSNVLTLGGVSAGNSMPSTGDIINENGHFTPKGVQQNQPIPDYSGILAKTKTLKRIFDVTQEGTIERPAKYVRIDGDEGRMISAYFSPGNEEKLQDFNPIYINVGNPKIAKELVGVRKNTQFCASGGKAKSKSEVERINYLVVSFENRKKSTSPFVEYPLSKIGLLINALQELKQYSIDHGYYNEGKILSCKYPESTTIMAGDSKDTLLETIE